MADQLLDDFQKQSYELYSLAFLLTGNADRSVEAFNRVLDFEGEANPTFDDFMNWWARKLIIVEALGTISAELESSKQRVARAAEDAIPTNAKWQPRPHIGREEFEEAVIAIDAFPRCAMLLTIFEGMSIEEAALLLNEDEAMTRRAQQIGIVQLTNNLAADRGRDPYRESDCNPVPVLSLS